MEMTGHSYSSGEWLVRQEARRSSSRPGLASSSGRWITGRGRVLRFGSEQRSLKVPLFRGVGEPRGAGGVARDPRMQMMLGQCRALCDEFDPHRYTLAASSAR